MNSRRGNRWVAEVGAARPAWSQSLVAGAGRAAAWPRANTGDIIAPSDPPDPTADSGWQAGTCTEPTPPTCSSTPRASSSNRPPPTRPRLHPVHRQAHDEPPAARKTGRRTEDRPGRPAGRPQRQPAGDRRSCPLATFEAGAAGCPAGSKVGESVVTAASLGVAIAADPGSPGPRLQRRPAARASRPASASNCSATKSSSKPTSTGTATTTRASRSHVPKALPNRSGSKG